MRYLILTFMLLASLLQAAPAIPTNAVISETVSVLYSTNRVASLGPSNAVTLINSMITAATNGLVTQVITNGLASTNYVIAATNDLVTKSVTNGLASSASVISATNPIPSWITSATSGFVTQSVTNGLASTNYVDNSVNSVRTNYARLVEVETGIFVIYKGQ